MVDRLDVRSVARYVVGLAPVSEVARETYLRLGMQLGLDEASQRPSSAVWRYVCPACLSPNACKRPSDLCPACQPIKNEKPA
jgi:rubrerythrin